MPIITDAAAPAEMPEIAPALLARLEAVYGLLTGEVDPRFGSVEVLTPYGIPYKFVWISPSGLESLIADWEARDDLSPRFAFVLIMATREQKVAGNA